MLEECKRVEKLGLMYLNIHPGSTTRKCTKEESIKRIASAINHIHSHTSYMTIVLENTAGGGGTIGVDFRELKSIIDAVENKDRIGVCIDTCHAFASGIDLTKKNGVEKMVKDFDEVIGLKYLKAMHLNDSTGGLGSNRDVHQPLGEGQLGLDTFRQIMNCDALRGIPLILETPWGQNEYGPNHGWAKEIKLLRSYVGVKEIEQKKTGIAKLFDKKKTVKEEKPKEEKKEKTAKKEKVEKKGTKKINSTQIHGVFVQQRIHFFELLLFLVTGGGLRFCEDEVDFTVKKESIRLCLHLSFAFSNRSIYEFTRSGLNPLSLTKNDRNPSLSILVNLIVTF